jgi:diphosphomevalonate decarboxylase
MHAMALAAKPAVLYWNAATVAAMRAIWDLRAGGVEAYFTCDAGPQPKALCTGAREDTVAAALAQVPGVSNIIRCKLAPGARLI